MIIHEGAVHLLLITLLISAQAANKFSNGKVNHSSTFIRSAVESMVKSDDHNINSLSSSGNQIVKYSAAITYDDVFLPLRSAVETIPTVSSAAEALTSEPTVKTFIRQALESKPSSLEYENEIEVEPVSPSNRYSFFINEETNSDIEKYSAYIIPTTYDEHDPQPFRFGSPYQQLVDPSSIEKKKNSALRLQKDFADKPKVLCYMTNWSNYRKNDGKFAPENLDTSLCTAVIYSFASLDPETLFIREFDPWMDIENELYKRTTSLDIPVLIALGGWTDSVGDKFSRLVNDPTARQLFTSNLIGFLQTHGFSGLHFDWTYPKCWQSDCSKGPVSDKPNFTKMIKEIREAFDRVDPNLQLGIAISGYKEVITVAYELSALSKYANYLTVMSYDYHGSWEMQTGHVSPLYGRPSDKFPQYNTDFTMQLLVKNGANPEKLIMGIPFYGQTFTLSETHNSIVGEGIPSNGPGEPGEFTKQPGMLAYYEICQKIRKNKWLTGRDPSRKSGPFAMFKNQWVGFEDPASVEAKARYALNYGFGGVAAWTVDLDDFQNRCCSEAFPLLKAINRALGRLSTPPPGGINCQRPPQPVTPVAPVMTTVGESGIYEHSTWPSWSTSSSESSSTKPSTTTWPSWHPSSTERSTIRPSTTSWPTWTQSSKQPSSTSLSSSSTWWPRPTPTVSIPTITTQSSKQPTSTSSSSSSTQPSTWWPRPTPTVSIPTTTKRPITTSTRKTTASPVTSTTIPSPAVIMPVTETLPCIPGEFKANPKSCNSYYHCVYGELKQQFCAGGLHWNDQKKLCDWPQFAKCKVKEMHEDGITNYRPKPTTQRTTRSPSSTTSVSWWQSLSTKRTTTSKPVSAVSVMSAAFDPQLLCENGRYYPHKDCKKFYICVNNKLVPQACGAGLHWNTKTEICDWERNVPCLSTKSYMSFYKAELKNEFGLCDENTHLPYPGSCDQYLICLWGRLEVASCAPGLHWNQKINMCDWPAKANCKDENSNSVDTSSKPTKKPESPITTTTTTQRPTYPTNKPKLEPLSGYYKVVCYFTNWAWYRKGLGRYTPDDINTDLCTHIVYGFAVLDYSELTIRTHDSWADIENNFYTRVSSLKEKGVNVSLALGGWNDSQGDKYSRLVRNPAARAKFVRQAVQFIEKYGFEGLDLDWEYPVCWQTDCKKGFPEEKEGFSELVKELSREFKPRGWLLSSAVSPSKKIIDAGYDVPTLAKYFDWIAVMTYDFHGQWDKKTGHVAPLFHHPDDDNEYFNTNFSINYWIEKGAPSRKLVLGMPLYGQAFTLADSKANGLNAHAPGPGQAGEFTRQAGFLAYYEICDRIKTKGWTVVHDKLGRMGPYAYHGNQWVSFDDQETLKKKSQLVRSLNLGGGMVWALDLDDFRNRCGDGVHPLLTTIRNVLKDPPKGHEPAPLPIPEELETDLSGETLDHDVVEQTEQFDNQIMTNSADSVSTGLSDEYKVVCYFTNWAWYRQGGGKYLPEDIDPDLCTHIVYGFAVLNRESLTITPHDSWADIDNRFYERVVAWKAKGKKVTIAIGGWNDSAGDKYSRLVKNPQARAKFVKTVTEFIEKYNFDGLDLDWEYPVCWQTDCKKGFPDEKEGFSALVQELSVAFKPKGLLLSSAVSPNKVIIDAGYDVPILSKYFDWIAVMTYDYHGQWDKKTGHVAPMYEHPEDDNPTFNANFSIHYWIEKGADRRKLIMGMPMYGQSFSLAENHKNTLNSPTYGGGEAGEATRARGFLAYYEICRNIRERGWKVVRDRRGRMGPYAYLRDQWVSFDDTNMIRHKSEYVKAMNLGGAMIWALDLDDFRNVCDCESYPLLRTINRVLRNYPEPHPNCKLEEESEFAPETDEKNKPDRTTTTAGPSTWWPTASTTSWWTSSSTTTTKPYTSTTDTSNNTKLKECNGRTFAPHENNCNKYYMCQFGILREQNCPEGLYWNENRCDWPHNTMCNSTDYSSTPTPTTKKPEYYPEEKPTKKPIEVPTKKPTSIKPIFSENDNGFKVVCYFTNWAWYRPGEGKYTPDDIDENLCTHIVYGFAVLNGETLTIRTHDSWADIDNGFYEKVTALRNKGIRVTLAIGGWNDSQGDKYSRLVRSPAARKNFVKDTVNFLEKYGFEGLDLDWEYPVCWQVDCSRGSPEEKQGFADLVRELSIEFKPRGLLLSAAVSPSKMVIDAGYDVPTLSRYFDWIAVMTYDFHGHWDKQTGHVAPLYYVEGDTYDYFNANFSMNYWIEKGAPPKKLVMGMPLYGQTFSLADVSTSGLNAKAYGPGESGRYTRARGFLAYYEICENINNGGWTVVRDPEGRIGPYAYRNNQWVSYDDVSEIKRKSQFIKNLGLGGGMIWALDLDDFKGRCGCGKHPLLRTLTQELRNVPGQRASDCT